MQWNLAKVQKRARASSSVVAKVSSKIWQQASHTLHTVSFREGAAQPSTPRSRTHKVAESPLDQVPPPAAAEVDGRPHSSAGSRYTVYGEIASGGMAVVQYGRLSGPSGFARGVAIKRLHAQFARDPHFVSMFLDEARLAARVAHANVIPTLDVLATPGEVSVVMEYVPGEALSGLLTIAGAHGLSVPVRIAVTLLAGTLHGLHAAHETRSEEDELLHIVHRDVSPQNILVGSDGVARLIDFGIAKARGRSRVTPTGELKGKLAYMAPEQYRGEEADRRVDVYGASVVLWETLTGRMLFDGPNDAAVARAVLGDEVPKPSTLRADIPEALDRIVLRGLSRERELRYATAREMALALEREVGVVPQSEVSDWVHGLAGDVLTARAETVRQMRLRGDRQLTPAPGHGSTRRIVSSDELAQRSSDQLAQRSSDQLAQRSSDKLADGAHTPAPADPALARAITRTSEARSSTRVAGLSLGAPRLKVALLAGGALLMVAGGLTVQHLLSPEPERAGAVLHHGPPPLPALELRGSEALAPTPRAPEPEAEAAPVLPAAIEPAPARPAEVGKVVPREGLEKPRAPRDRDARSAEHEPAARKERAHKKAQRLDCSEPVEVDAMGIRRVKRECL
jgi:serine/threonine-protein kinase